MEYFIAIPSNISDCACHFDKQYKSNSQDSNNDFYHIISSKDANGLPIRDNFCIRLSPDFPKENRLYDLHEVVGGPSIDNYMLVSERVYKFLIKWGLKNLDTHTVKVHDIKNKPLDGTYYIIRQLHHSACLDEKKSVVARFDSGKIFAVDRLVLDIKRVPKGVDLFRAEQYTKVLIITEALAKAFISAGFVGFDYVKDVDWRLDVAIPNKVRLLGPNPGKSSKVSSKSTTSSRRIMPQSLASFVEKLHGSWIDLKTPLPSSDETTTVSAWVFDWRKLNSTQRKAIEEADLLGGAGEDTENIPFAILHYYDEILKDLGRKPKTLKDILSIQTLGLLMCDASGTVFYLDSGSRTDMVSSPDMLKFKIRI